MNWICLLLGLHRYGKPKPWMIKGKMKRGAYCKRCGKFQEMQ